MMNKKIICMGIVSMFLLTSIVSLSVLGISISSDCIEAEPEKQDPNDESLTYTFDVGEITGRYWYFEKDDDYSFYVNSFGEYGTENVAYRYNKMRCVVPYKFESHRHKTGDNIELKIELSFDDKYVEKIIQIDADTVYETNENDEDCLYIDHMPTQIPSRYWIYGSVTVTLYNNGELLDSETSNIEIWIVRLFNPDSESETRDISNNTNKCTLNN